MTKKDKASDKKAPKPRHRKALWAGVILLFPVLLFTIGGIRPSFLSFGSGGGDSSADAGETRTTQAQPAWDDGALRYPVTLRGSDVPSDIILVLGDGSRPQGTRCIYEGPPSAELLLADGTRVPITGASIRGVAGPVRMLGPAGQSGGAICFTS